MTNACGNCRWFRRAGPLMTSGVCRSRPPVPMMIGSSEGKPLVATYWPQVPDSELCGDWHERSREADMKNIDISSIDVAEIEGTA